MDLIDDDVLEQQQQQAIRPSFLEGGALINQNDYDYTLNSDIIRNLSEDFKREDDKKVKTYLRIRPPKAKKPGSADITDFGRKYNSADTYVVEDPQTLIVKGREARKKIFGKREIKFKFDNIMDVDCSQSTVFEQTTEDLLEHFFTGTKCLVFSYGATDSGKTYTMQGYGKNFGIIPRTFDAIFNKLEDKIYFKSDVRANYSGEILMINKRQMDEMQHVKDSIMSEVKSCKSSDYESFRNAQASSKSSYVSDYSVFPGFFQSVPAIEGTENKIWPVGTLLHCLWVSFVEIYNEKVYDLLKVIDKKKIYGKVPKRKELRIVSNGRGGFYIKDLLELPVHSAEEAYRLFLAGKRNLQFASTKANENSSRSHSFFNLQMITIKTSQNNGILAHDKSYRLSFCDLAGVERLSQTGNVGDRLNESNKINNSLFQLLRCMRDLRFPSKNKPLLRDSKLTQLFSEYLAGNAKISMIVNISPDPEQLDSSLAILQNSAIASQVIPLSQVELPMNNTNFYKKLRESLGGSSLADIEKSREEDAEQLATVIRKPVGEPLTEKYIRLELENKKLKREIEDIEDKTRVTLEQEFKIILDEHIANFNKIYEENKEVEINLNKRRFSLSLRFFNIAKNQDDKTEDIKQDEENDNTLNSSSVNNDSFATPTVTHPDVIHRNYRQENLDLKEKVETLLKSLDNQRLKNSELEGKFLQLKENHDTKINEVIEDNNDKIKQLVTSSEDSNNNKNLLAERNEKLIEELDEKDEKIKNLEKELEDASETCIEYHNKLEEGNLKIQELNSNCNDLNGLREDYQLESQAARETIADLRKEISKLKLYVGIKTSQASDTESESENQENIRTRSKITPKRYALRYENKTSRRRTTLKRKTIKKTKKSGASKEESDESFVVSPLEDDEDEKEEAEKSEEESKPKRAKKNNYVMETDSSDPEILCPKPSAKSSKIKKPQRKPARGKQ